MQIYHHIAVAVTLSPRLPLLLAEAVRLAGRFGSKLSLIHVGEKGEERSLRDALERNSIPSDIPILKGEGNPAHTIMTLAEEHGVDLLIAGALEKERAFRYFLGSVARTLVREFGCSLMLFTEPQLQPHPLRRIVVITDFSEMSMIALRKAMHLASREGSEGIDLVRVHSTYGEAMAMAKGTDRGEMAEYIERTEAEERALLTDFIDAAGYSPVGIRPVYLEGKEGAVAANYAHDLGAELLVIPSERSHAGILERIFPSDMEWVLREIPCNLWVVREKIQ